MYVLAVPKANFCMVANWTHSLEVLLIGCDVSQALCSWVMICGNLLPGNCEILLELFC
jgi:hypothetical protein